MRDFLQEIGASLSRNKLRTSLTGFAVAWGIFMLLVLLGAGNGIIHTFQANMNTNALNTLTIYGRTTKTPYKGYKEGRDIRLDNRDLKVTEEDFPENISGAGALVSQNNVTVSNGAEYVSIRLNGVHPSYDHINALKIVEGRFINPLDIREQRKTIVLHKKTAEILFKHGEPTGKYVKAGNAYYLVAGIYNDQGNDQNAPAYIPFTTLQQIFNKGNRLDLIVATTEGLDTQEKSEDFETEYRKTIAGIHDFDPDDKGALYISNRLTQYQQVMTAMGLMQLSLWIIGIFTLVSGIVGVSNIMFITVKERTHEFGIRKALGAKPRAIYKLIVVESIAITTLFGYIGMVCGVAATEWMNKKYGSTTVDFGDGGTTMFIDPTVDIRIAIGATLLLIMAGMLAGLFPARKAANVRPIEALNAR